MDAPDNTPRPPQPEPLTPSAPYGAIYTPYTPPMPPDPASSDALVIGSPEVSGDSREERAPEPAPPSNGVVPLPVRPLRGGDTAILPRQFGTTPEPLPDMSAPELAGLAPRPLEPAPGDPPAPVPFWMAPAPTLPPAEAAPPAPAPIWSAPPTPLFVPTTAANVPPAVLEPPVSVAPAAPLIVPVADSPALVVPVAPSANVSAATPQSGAMVLLPQEEVVNQLGALYLTNKRVILYAPTILRAAFLRDVDAVGTLTERASGFALFFGVLLLALAGVLGYIASTPNPISAGWPFFSQSPLWLPPLAIGVLGLILLATYFFWMKKSLFLSVGGRPLIVVSLTGWSTKRLEGVDILINA